MLQISLKIWKKLFHIYIYVCVCVCVCVCVYIKLPYLPLVYAIEDVGSFKL